jgi:hypothetical protein
MMSRVKKMVLEILALLEPSPTRLTLAKRFGAANDGGYVLINDISKKDFLVSMGVANDVRFEKEISSLLNAMHLYDDSINSLPENLTNCTFFGERIGGIGNVSISDTIRRAKNVGDFILKMDIEGSEWDTLDAESEDTLKVFRQIAVEFHWFNDLNDFEYLDKSLRVLRKLTQSHFVLNVHPNNWGELFYINGVMFPQVIEVTFLRRDDYEIVYDLVNFKKDLSKLNSPCNPNVPEICLNGFGFYTNSHNEETKTLILTLEKIDELTQQRDQLTQQRDQLTQQRDQLTQQRDQLTQQRDQLINSRIWKITKPLRDLINFAKK